MQRSDWAWLAGLYEGEGSVGAYKSGKYYSMALQIRMTDFDTLYQIYELLDVGNLTGPLRNNNRDKEFWTFRISNLGDIEHLMIHMWEWLSPRRREQFKQAALKYLNNSKYLERV